MERWTKQVVDKGTEAVIEETSAGGRDGASRRRRDPLQTGKANGRLAKLSGCSSYIFSHQAAGIAPQPPRGC